jgi:hypothetical protein
LASSPPPLQPRPPVPTKPPLNYTPILITMACAFVLGLGSCFGFVTAPSSHQSLAGALEVIFLVCLLVFLLSLLWLVIRVLINAFRS